VDEDDNRYEPELPDSTIRPPIVGAEVAPNESLLGMVLFRLPPDVVPAYLEWCIAGDCEQAIQAPIP
jgi:hypothetical protein